MSDRSKEEQDRWRELADLLGLPPDEMSAPAATLPVRAVEPEPTIVVNVVVAAADFAFDEPDPEIEDTAEPASSGELEPDEPRSDSGELPSQEDSGPEKSRRRRRGRRGRKGRGEREPGAEGERQAEGALTAETTSASENGAIPLAEEPGAAPSAQPASETEEGEEKPGRRRRRRRGRKRSNDDEPRQQTDKIAAEGEGGEPRQQTENAQGEDDDDEADLSEGLDDEPSEKTPVPKGVDDDDDEEDTFADWDVPSWNELIGSLYRPPDR